MMNSPNDGQPHYAYVACTFEGTVRYGIVCLVSADQTPSILLSVIDITSDAEQIEKLTEILNRMQVAPEHLRDVVNDFLVDEEAVLGM